MMILSLGSSLPFKHGYPKRDTEAEKKAKLQPVVTFGTESKPVHYFTIVSTTRELESDTHDVVSDEDVTISDADVSDSSDDDDASSDDDASDDDETEEKRRVAETWRMKKTLESQKKTFLTVKTVRENMREESKPYMKFLFGGINADPLYTMKSNQTYTQAYGDVISKKITGTRTNAVLTSYRYAEFEYTTDPNTPSTTWNPIIATLTTMGIPTKIMADDNNIGYALVCNAIDDRIVDMIIEESDKLRPIQSDGFSHNHKVCINAVKTEKKKPGSIPLTLPDASKTLSFWAIGEKLNPKTPPDSETWIRNTFKVLDPEPKIPLLTEKTPKLKKSPGFEKRPNTNFDIKVQPSKEDVSPDQNATNTGYQGMPHVLFWPEKLFDAETEYNNVTEDLMIYTTVAVFLNDATKTITKTAWRQLSHFRKSSLPEWILLNTFNSKVFQSTIIPQEFFSIHVPVTAKYDTNELLMPDLKKKDLEVFSDDDPVEGTDIIDPENVQRFLDTQWDLAERYIDEDTVTLPLASTESELADLFSEQNVVDALKTIISAKKQDETAKVKTAECMQKYVIGFEKRTETNGSTYLKLYRWLRTKQSASTICTTSTEIGEHDIDYRNKLISVGDALYTANWCHTEASTGNKISVVTKNVVEYEITPKTAEFIQCGSPDPKTRPDVLYKLPGGNKLVVFKSAIIDLNPACGVRVTSLERPR